MKNDSGTLAILCEEIVAAEDYYNCYCIDVMNISETYRHRRKDEVASDRYNFGNDSDR